MQIRQLCCEVGAQFWDWGLHCFSYTWVSQTVRCSTVHLVSSMENFLSLAGDRHQSSPLVTSLPRHRGLRRPELYQLCLRLCRAGFALSTGNRSVVFFWDFFYSGGRCNDFKYFELCLSTQDCASWWNHQILLVSTYLRKSHNSLHFGLTLRLRESPHSCHLASFRLRVPIIIPCWNDPNSTRLSVSGCLFFNCS